MKCKRLIQLYWECKDTYKRVTTEDNYKVGFLGSSIYVVDIPKTVELNVSGCGNYFYIYHFNIDGSFFRIDVIRVNSSTYYVSKLGELL